MLGISNIKKIRLVVFITIIFAVMVSLMFAGSAKASRKDAGVGEEKYYKSIYIENGETLWHLASEYADEEHYGNKHEYINEIKKMNNLKSDRIKSGSYLLVVYYE